MTFRELARGVEIFSRYVDDAGHVHIGSYFVFMCGHPPTEMPPEHVEELTNCGWKWSSDGCWSHPL